MRDKMKRDDLHERVSRRQHRDMPDVIGFGHGTVDREREGHGVAIRKDPRHHQMKALRRDRGFSGQLLDKFRRIIARGQR